MIVAQVNALYGTGSTGKICRAIGERLAAEGDASYILHVQEQPNTDNHISYASPAYIRMQAVKSRLLGNYGFNGRAATKRLIAHLERIRPDVVHLHNMHSHNAHLTLLFRYLKKKKIKVVWTFHDCWTFTSYYPHFIKPSAISGRRAASIAPSTVSTASSSTAAVCSTAVRRSF